MLVNESRCCVIFIYDFSGRALRLIISLFNQLFLFFNKGDLLFVFRNDSCTLVEIIAVYLLIS